MLALSAGVVGFPLLLMTSLAVWPYALSVLGLPGVLVLYDLLRRGTDSRRPHLARILLTLAAAGGVVAAHGTGLFNLAVLTLPFLVDAAASLWRRSTGSRGGRALLTTGAVAVVLALGTGDKLSEGTLLADEDAGGEQYRSYISGTGTIDANGKVGAIGGIKYKILATGRYGARYFLAPKENCESIVKMHAKDPDLFNYYHAGQVRGTMVVVPVSILDEAVNTVEAIKSGTPDDSLPRCGS